MAEDLGEVEAAVGREQLNVVGLDRDSPAQRERAATASISTRAPAGSAATCTVARAGWGAGK